MTDQEKIARMVEWMGGWPPHVSIYETNKYVHKICRRCGLDRSAVGDRPKCNWNPFERIEDAFLLFEKIREETSYTLSLYGNSEWVARVLQFSHEWGYGTGATPARALAEAAYQVIKEKE